MADPVVVDPPAPKLFKDIAPAELHDRGWIKPFLDKPFTPELGVELSKKLDGAEALIGKKTLIPGADVTDEKELDAFYSKLRPEKADDYDVKALGEKPDEGLVKTMREAAHKAGMDKRQFSAFLAGLAPDIAARQKAVAEAQAARDKEFEGIVASTFGKENEKVVARVGEALKEFTPEPLKPHIDKLDNNALAIVTGVINAIMLKFVPEDQINGKDKGDGGGSDKGALQAEARALQASEAWKNFQHPDHEKTKKRVAEIYANPVFKQ